MSTNVLLKQARSDLKELVEASQICLASFLRKKLSLSEARVGARDLAGLLDILINRWTDIFGHGRTDGFNMKNLAHQVRDEIRHGFIAHERTEAVENPHGFIAHERTEAVENPSVEDIYRHLDTLGRFLEVIEGDECLIQRVRDNKINAAKLFIDQELPREHQSADSTSSFEASEGDTGSKSEFGAAPTDEAIQSTSEVPITDASQDVPTSSTGQTGPVTGGHGTAIPPAPDDAKVYFDRGLPKLSDEQYKAAIATCDAVIAQDKESADAYNDRGVVKLRHGDYDGAIKDFTKAISCDPNYVPAYTNGSTAVKCGHKR